ncbi:MAG: hypothetical protein KGK07_09435 [Chloroflexota bacterium]|nr:hypothetical protein [Chloroflexota bacterium]
MFGSMFRMRPKAGARQQVIDLMSAEGAGRTMKGFRASYVLEDAGGDLLGLAVFDDEKTYRDNAADPEQDQWYRRLRALLESDPEWHDGAIHAWTP